MGIALSIVSGLLIMLSLLPFIQNQHWFFRVPEFIKLQLLALQVLVFTSSFCFLLSCPVAARCLANHAFLYGYPDYIRMRNTKLWKPTQPGRRGEVSEQIQLLSCHVYQSNNSQRRFITLIHEEQPD